jgi:hypothetical protein
MASEVDALPSWTPEGTEPGFADAGGSSPFDMGVAADPAVIESLASLLENWPDDMILGDEIWRRPSEASDRQPALPIPPWVVNLHESDDDNFKPFHEIVPPARVAEIKQFCRHRADGLRSGETPHTQALCELPDEARRGLRLLLAARRAYEEAGGDGGNGCQ